MINVAKFINVAKLANPSYFMSLSARILPWLAGATALLLAIGLYLSLSVTSAEEHGNLVYVMFIHVPTAWLGMACYAMITVSAIGSLVWRHPLADVSVKAAAPIGAIFTLLALITGALWGRPMWGTYWAWDPRLTSMLVLFFIYLGLIAMSRSIEEPSRAGRATAILALVGSVNIPIIKFSVDWWNTQHQNATLSLFKGTAMPWEYRIPLLLMALAFTCLLFWLHMKGMRAEILRRRVETLMITRVNRLSELKVAE